MRDVISFAGIIMVLFLCSCKKELNSKTIEGKWNIISDSSYQGVAANNHFAGYMGEPGDYFNFHDGKLDIKEDIALNSTVYKFISGSSISILSFVSSLNYKDTCTITYNNKNDIVIASEFLYNPGGASGRKVHLKR